MNFPTSLLNPSIIESSNRGEIAYDIASLLFRERIVILGVPINDQVAMHIVAQLLILARQDSTKPIRLYISSPGNARSPRSPWVSPPALAPFC